MLTEYERILASLSNYSLPDKEALAKKIFDEVEGKSIEEIIWREEGGRGKPLGFYYNGTWHKIEDYKGDEVEGIEIIRKAKRGISDKTEEELAPEYWRVRKIKFVRKNGKMVSVGNWREYPTEITKKVWNIVGEVYSELFKEYPFFEITLFGSAANGSMKNGSDVEYAIIFYNSKIKERLDYKLTPGTLEYWIKVREIKQEIQRKFENKVIEIARKRGISLEIGYSYIVSKEEDGKIYDPYGPSRKYPIRLLYSGDKMEFINYKEIIK